MSQGSNGISSSADIDFSEIVEWEGRLPQKVVSTLFDSLFLDGNKTKLIAKQLTASEQAVHDVITGGAIYGTTISKPWFGKQEIPFHSIRAGVHGSIVNAADRHVLDCLIAIGQHLPPEVLRDKTLNFAIDYYAAYANKQVADSFQFDQSFCSYETSANLFNNNVFNNQHYYYMVDVDKLLGAIPLKVKPENKRRLLDRLDRLGLTEFRLEFIDSEENSLGRGKFKLLEPVYYPILNLAKVKRQRKQLKPESFTHILVGVARGYIKSLHQHATINKGALISQFAGLSSRANLQDFCKWLYSNKRSYIQNKSLKDFIKEYYTAKAYTGGTYITTKVNTTFRELILPEQIPIIEDCFNCQLIIKYKENGKPADAVMKFFNDNPSELILAEVK